MKSLKQMVEETRDYIRSKIDNKPAIGIILGTGLGSLANHIKAPKSVAYSTIPHFPSTTFEAHAGKLIFGSIAGKEVVVMQGRVHYYEGYSLEEITYPIRVMRALGASYLMESNAAGGINPLFKAGDLMIIEDHINLFGDNPLRGPNEEELGPRFPDMSQPYDHDLIQLAEAVALEEKTKLQKGVYVGVAGPNLETRAEYRLLKLIGADVVGMSTVPEVIVAVHSGLKVLGISCITDMCLPDALKSTSIEEIIKVAEGAEPKLTNLVSKIIERMKV